MDARQKSEQAFAAAALAATVVLRSVLENPSVAKSETAPGEAAAGMAKILVNKIAAETVLPLEAERYFDNAVREERAIELWKADRIAVAKYYEAHKHKIHPPDCACEPCGWQRDEDATYARLMAEKWTTKAAVAKQAIEKAALTNRPHLDAARAEAEPDGPPAVPWFESEPTIEDDEPEIEKTWSPEARAAALEARRRNQNRWVQTPAAPPSQTPWLPTKPAPPSRVPWKDTPTMKALMEILKSEDFESDGPLVDHPQIEVYVHHKNQHRIELNTETARFRAVSGWDHAVATGTGPDDVEQWITEEN